MQNHARFKLTTSSSNNYLLTNRQNQCHVVAIICVFRLKFAFGFDLWICDLGGVIVKCLKYQVPYAGLKLKLKKCLCAVSSYDVIGQVCN